MEVLRRYVRLPASSGAAGQGLVHSHQSPPLGLRIEAHINTVRLLGSAHRNQLQAPHLIVGNSSTNAARDPQVLVPPFAAFEPTLRLGHQTVVPPPPFHAQRHSIRCASNL